MKHNPIADFVVSKYLFSDCHQVNSWSGVDGSES